MDPLKNYWTEYYRPPKIEEGLILNDDMKSKFMEYANDSTKLPHLLLVGPPGTGKTTVALALINAIIKDNGDCLRLNGSVDNGIDVIRNRIMSFLSTPPMRSEIKIVYIDECDGLSDAAFGGLRATIEQPGYNYHLASRFLFTANYINKIPAPIQSRFTIFRIDAMPKESIRERCIKILDAENVAYENDVLDRIIAMYYPDMRSIIKELQHSTLNGTLTYVVDNSQQDVVKLINEVLHSDNSDSAIIGYNECRKLITEETDVKTLLSDLMTLNESEILILPLILECYNSASLSVIPRHTLLGMMATSIQRKFGYYV